MNAKRSSRRRTNLLTNTVEYPTIDWIKEQLGITDADLDDEIAAMLNAVLAMIENYCDRTLQEGDYIERFGPIESRYRSLLLRAYPVKEVRSVKRDGVDVTGWKLWSDAGVLKEFVRGCCWCCMDVEVSVDYTGGYPDDAWPADLADVLTQVFFARWNATGGTGSYASGGASEGTGEIKAFTVDGVRIDYDIGGGRSSAASASGGGVPPELAPFVAILDRYVSLRAPGV